MDYLIWQIGLCLLVAFLLGALLGWFFRGNCKNKVARVANDWEQRFGFMEEERDLFALKVQDRERLYHENKSLLGRLVAMKNGANLASKVLKENKEKLDVTEEGLSELVSLLEQRDLEIIELKNDVSDVVTIKEETDNVDLTSNDEEIKVMEALLKAHEKGSDDLLKKEKQLQKALSSTEDKNLEYEEEAAEDNVKIERLMLELESSKKKERESIDEMKMMQALLLAHEKGNSYLPEEKNKPLIVNDVANSENKKQQDFILLDKPENEKTIVSEGSYNIEEIKGIGKGFAKRLQAINIQTTTDLLEKCLNKGDKKHIAGILNENEKTVESWCCMADLLRVEGIGGKYAELLFLSGIRSTKELALLDTAKVERKIKNIVDNQHYSIKVAPTEDKMKAWSSSAILLLNSHS